MPPAADTENSLNLKSCTPVRMTARSRQKESQARVSLLTTAPAPAVLFRTAARLRRAAAPRTETRRIAERKMTAAITALVYLMAVARTPATVNSPPISKPAVSDSISKSARPAALSGVILMPLMFLNAEMSCPSKTLLSCSSTERIWSCSPFLPGISTLTPR